MKEFLNTGEWTTSPPYYRAAGSELHVRPTPGSDFWQQTLYGFSRDSGHALLAPISVEGSLEVTFHGTFTNLYDQGGLMIRTDQKTWIKAGLEITDDELRLAAVVTNGYSDWSMAATPNLNEGPITLRASWSKGAVTLRAKSQADTLWQTLRVAPFVIDSERTRAGVFVCSPQAEGLEVTFSRIAFGRPDLKLHTQPD